MSTLSYPASPVPPVPLTGDGMPVPCADGTERPYLSMDAAASTAPLEPVAARVQEFLPWYSSVHRGAGDKSQLSTRAYEDARSAALALTGRPPGGPGDDIAIICRNTTEALNHLGESNITGWMPPLAEIIAAAHDRNIPVAVDAAQQVARAAPGHGK
jgi:selenocysteine lyase/cysteine desulfurase